MEAERLVRRWAAATEVNSDLLRLPGGQRPANRCPKRFAPRDVVLRPGSPNNHAFHVEVRDGPRHGSVDMENQGERQTLGDSDDDRLFGSDGYPGSMSGLENPPRDIGLRLCRTPLQHGEDRIGRSDHDACDGRDRCNRSAVAVEPVENVPRVAHQRLDRQRRLSSPRIRRFRAPCDSAARLHEAVAAVGQVKLDADLSSSWVGFCRGFCRQRSKA